MFMLQEFLPRKMTTFFFPFKACSLPLCLLTMESGKSLRPGAQDLFVRLGDVLPFVMRKSEQGVEEGRDSTPDITLTFRIKLFV